MWVKLLWHTFSYICWLPHSDEDPQISVGEALRRVCLIDGSQTGRNGRMSAGSVFRSSHSMLTHNRFEIRLADPPQEHDVPWPRRRPIRKQRLLFREGLNRECIHRVDEGIFAASAANSREGRSPLEQDDQWVGYNAIDSDATHYRAGDWRLR